jgi:hypothetical protein
MAGRRLLMNVGRTTKQGQQINIGKDSPEYEAIVNTITMHPGLGGRKRRTLKPSLTPFLVSEFAVVSSSICVICVTCVIEANTAKVLEGNPTLMRLRELEVLERVAGSGKLNVVLGEKGLAERIVNLI